MAWTLKLTSRVLVIITTQSQNKPNKELPRGVQVWTHEPNWMLLYIGCRFDGRHYNKSLTIRSLHWDP